MFTNHWTNLKDYESSLKTMNDEDVLKQLGKLFQREKHLADAILINLQETYDRRLFAKEGFSSMFEMLVKRFGHSESAAYQRTSALKLIQAVPAAKEALAKGETSMTTMADTQKFISRLDKENPLGAKLSAKEKEAIFNKVKGKTRKVALTLFAALNPVAALPETKEKLLSSKHTLLQVTIEQETLDLLNELKSVLSHEIPDGNLNLELKRIAIIGLEQLKKAKGRSDPKTEQLKSAVAAANVTEATASDLQSGLGDLKSTKPCDDKTDHSCVAGSMNSTGKHKRKAIPIEVRRLAFARANYRCEYVSANGTRCEG